MVVDTTDPPDYGNQTAAQFAARRWMQVVPANQEGTNDTWDLTNACINSVWYRQLKEDLAQVNLALRGEHPTPLLTIAQTGSTQNWTPTDNGAKELTLAEISNASLQAPTALFSCNGQVTDEVTGSIDLVDRTAGTQHPVYSIVSATGSLGASGDALVGLRVHGDRWNWANSHIAALSVQEITASVTGHIEWPQANEGIVLLKLADFTSGAETGAVRMGFEFGLAAGLGAATDPLTNDKDLVLYCRWYDAGDVEQVVYATVNGKQVGVTPGREYCFGFHRFQVEPAEFGVNFYINGIKLFGQSAAAVPLPPDISASTDLRIHVGATNSTPGGPSNTKHAGGPMRNVYALANPAGDIDALHLGLYRIGAGYQ